MLHLLRDREAGVAAPSLLTGMFISKRFKSLELAQWEIQRFHTGGINSIDIDPVEQKFLLSGGSDSSLAIFDLQELTNNEPQQVCNAVASVTGRSSTVAHRFSIETVQWFTDTGMFISCSMDHTVKVWDTNELVPAEEFLFNSAVYTLSMARSSSHCLVAVGTCEASINLCDLRTGSTSHILRGHKDSVLSLAWSPLSDFLLASGSRDNKVLLWDIRRAKGCLHALDQHNGREQMLTYDGVTAHNGHVNALDFTPDGLHLLTFGTDHRLRLWDVASGRNTLVNYGHVVNTSNKSLKIAVPDGTISPMVFLPSRNDIVAFDVLSGECCSTLCGHYQKSNCCAVRRGWQELYSGAKDSTILAWTPKELPPTDLVEKNSDVKARNNWKGKPAPAIPAALQDNWSSDEDAS